MPSTVPKKQETIVSTTVSQRPSRNRGHACSTLEKCKIDMSAVQDTSANALGFTKRRRNWRQRKCLAAKRGCQAALCPKVVFWRGDLPAPAPRTQETYLLLERPIADGPRYRELCREMPRNANRRAFRAERGLPPARIDAYLDRSTSAPTSLLCEP